MKGNYQLLNVLDTIDGRETTILLQLSTFPDNEKIPREIKHLVIHQIGGTYQTLEDFNNEWENGENQVEKTILCPKCKESIPYYTPKLDEILNYTCIEATDAKALAQAIIELTEETEGSRIKSRKRRSDPGKPRKGGRG